MEQTCAVKVEFLIYFPKTSRYSPTKEGEFIHAPEYGDLYVYGGRPLSIDEFNAAPPEIWERYRYSQQPRVKVLAKSVPAKPGPEPETEPEPEQETETKPEPEAKTRKAPRKTARKVAQRAPRKRGRPKKAARDSATDKIVEEVLSDLGGPDE